MNLGNIMGNIGWAANAGLKFMTGTQQMQENRQNFQQQQQMNAYKLQEEQLNLQRNRMAFDLFKKSMAGQGEQPQQQQEATPQTRENYFSGTLSQLTSQINLATQRQQTDMMMGKDTSKETSTIISANKEMANIYKEMADTQAHFFTSASNPMDYKAGWSDYIKQFPNQARAEIQKDPSILDFNSPAAKHFIQTKIQGAQTTAQIQSIAAENKRADESRKERLQMHNDSLAAQREARLSREGIATQGKAERATDKAETRYNREMDSNQTALSQIFEKINSNLDRDTFKIKNSINLSAQPDSTGLSPRDQELARVQASADKAKAQAVNDYTNRAIAAYNRNGIKSGLTKDEFTNEVIQSLSGRINPDVSGRWAEYIKSKLK